jgi:hypothetical protein
MVGLMDQGRIRIGMKVRITGIDITNSRHNSCSEMHAMVGQVWTVKKIRNAQQSATHELPPGTKMVSVYNDKDRGERYDYVWAPEDLEYAGPKVITPKKGTFNPDNLVRL